jgi:hypothetical protein
MFGVFAFGASYFSEGLEEGQPDVPMTTFGPQTHVSGRAQDVMIPSGSGPGRS